MGWTQPVFNVLHNEPAMAISHRRELREDPSMKVTRIGLDIAKQIFELHGVDRRGRVVVRKTLRRERVLEYFSQLPACEVALASTSLTTVAKIGPSSDASAASQS
jgi:hypothetical protein